MAALLLLAACPALARTWLVAPDGSEAIRRTVRLGRRNTDYIEVLDGLEPGEEVITSPYTSFVGMDRLVLDAD